MKRINGIAYPTVTEDGIYGFFREYRWLSNFHGCQIFMQGGASRIPYPSSEHAYMAQKTLNIKERIAIRDLPTPQDARSYGRSRITLRPDWESIKRDKMLEVLRCKFIQNKDLRILLGRTGDKYLEETNWWSDDFWGNCSGNGKNHLGRLLMRVRKELCT